MKPTEELMKEHEAIKRMLSVLEQICKRIEQGERLPSEKLTQILEFIKLFADQCHHGKEEDLLFPAMIKAGFPKDGGSIAVMLHEHVIGRNAVKGMAEAIFKYKQSNLAIPESFIENARTYIQLLHQHIDKEDNILYPLANQHLSLQAQQDLLEQFERVEREVIGVGIHEKFHELLQHLEEEFLEN
ncbi:MAG: hemerythrin domain-containing protein [Candidatus Hodarchaeota archaeon]